VLATTPPGHAAALVSHLQVTRCLLAQALGTVPLAQMTTIPVATASVTCIDYEDDGGDDNENADGPRATVHFQSFKPEAGLSQSKDGAN
jgi:broad specificity phosphatase PhoE